MNARSAAENVLAGAAASIGLLHLLNRVAEIVDVLERAIDRREPDIGDVIELVELLHHHVPDLARRHFAHAEPEQILDDSLDRGVHLLLGHHALVQRLVKAGDQLLAVEIRTPAVLLDDLRQAQLDGLVGREALAARRTTPPPAHAGAFLIDARVDDLRIWRVAERTLHGRQLARTLSAIDGMRAAEP